VIGRECSVASALASGRYDAVMNPTQPRPDAPVPTSGVMTVRARYCECDPMGVVHHGAYIPWLEMGRTELLREAGVSYAELEAAGVFLVIVKLECSYKRPAYYDDLVEVRTKVVGGSRVKIRHEYEVVRAEGRAVMEGDEGGGGNNLVQRRVAGEVLMMGSSMLACVGRGGRVAELPEWLTPTER